MGSEDEIYLKEENRRKDFEIISLKKKIEDMNKMVPYSMEMKQSVLSDEEKKDWKRYRITVKTSEYGTSSLMVQSPHEQEAMKSVMVYFLLHNMVDMNNGLPKIEVVKVQEIELGKAYEDDSGYSFMYFDDPNVETKKDES